MASSTRKPFYAERWLAPARMAKRIRRLIRKRAGTWTDGDMRLALALLHQYEMECERLGITGKQRLNAGRGRRASAS